MGANSPYWVTIRVLGERVVKVYALNETEARIAAARVILEGGEDPAGVERVDYEDPDR